MLCPACKVQLLIADRQGIEIGHCPTCRGVWLDRGELDKLIERSMSRAHRLETTERRRDGAPYGVARPDYDDDDDRHQGQHSGRRKGWLGNLIDFG